MVMIRLARIGKNKYPTYRIIVSDKRKDTKGSYLESLGHYNPNADPATFEIEKERLEYWLSKGAQLSDTLHNICINRGLIKGEKRNMMHKKEKVETPEAPKQPQAPATPPEAKKEETTEPTKEQK